MPANGRPILKKTVKGKNMDRNKRILHPLILLNRYHLLKFDSQTQVLAIHLTSLTLFDIEDNNSLFPFTLPMNPDSSRH